MGSMKNWWTTSPLVPWLIFGAAMGAGCVLVGAVAVNILR